MFLPTGSLLLQTYCKPIADLNLQFLHFLPYSSQIQIRTCHIPNFIICSLSSKLNRVSPSESDMFHPRDRNPSYCPLKSKLPTKWHTTSKALAALNLESLSKRLQGRKLL
jgi:hypothetical protein